MALLTGDLNKAIIENNKNKFCNFNNNGADINKIMPNIVDESIGMFGIDVIYIKLEILDKDINFTLGELKKRNYTEAIRMRVGTENKEDFSGGQETFNKYGFQQKDESAIYIGVVQLDRLLGRKPILGDLVINESFGKVFKIIGFEDEADMFYVGGLPHQYKIYLYEYIKGENDVFNIMDNIEISSLNDVKTISTIKQQDDSVINILDDTEERPIDL